MKIRRAESRLAMVLLLLCAPVLAARAACPSVGSQQVTVAGISERLEIVLDDRRVVRLAGLDPPDPGRGDPRVAANARAFLAARLAGRAVAMALVTQKPDRWGRALADLFAAPADGAAPESAALALLAAGYARVRPEQETRSCASERLGAETRARQAGLGLWADPAYAVIGAADLEELGRRDGQLALVEGVVLKVGQGRSRFYVDFGRRGGFTAVVARKAQTAFERAGRRLETLAGARVRVRGALDNRFGLRMEIVEPQQIERLDEAAPRQEATPTKEAKPGG